MLTHDVLAPIAGYHPIISCEGTGEEVLVRKLIEDDALIFSNDVVVDVTRKRKAADIQEKYLNYEYDWPVCIVRVLDSLREGFKLGTLYAKRHPVINIYTRPEIEMLIIIREKKFSDYAKRKSSIKPSVFCKKILKYSHVKSAEFLQEYWSDTDAIIEAAIEYRRLSHLGRGELCLADIIRQ